jgi:hypothetical protein
MNNLTVAQTDFSTVQGAFAFNYNTDRIVTKVSGHTDSTSGRTVHFVYSGNTHYSHIETPINIANYGYLRSADNATISGNWTSTGSSTFDKINMQNASTTNMTLSNALWLPSLVSKLLRTNADGQVSETTIGTGLAFDGTTLSSTPIGTALTKGYFLVGDDAGVAQATSSVFVASTGSIGIGTLLPKKPLHVFSNTSDGISLFERLTTGSGNASYTTFLMQADSNAAIQNGFGPSFDFYVGDNTTETIGAKIAYISAVTDNNSTTTGNLTLAVQNSGVTNKAMTIKYNGNVGIGTTTPSYELDVTGFVNTDKYSGYKQDGDTILYSSTTNQSVSVGESAPWMSATSSAFYSVAVGYQALNTTPTSNTAQYNLGFGYKSLYSNATGKRNTGSGMNTLYSNTGGHYNSAQGMGALYFNTTGSYNTANGYQTGYADGTLADNRSVIDNYMTFVGAYASRDSSVASTSALNKATAIGYNSKVACSNCMALGGTGADAVNVGIGTTSPATTLDVNGTITQKTVKSCSLGLITDALGSITGCVTSDATLKKNIKPLKDSLSTLLGLSTRLYEWKDTNRDTQVHAGFIAQEVKKVFPEAVVKSGEKTIGVDPNAILSLVVHSVQDFYGEFQKLVARVSGLEKKVNAQEKRIQELEKAIKQLQK